MADVTIGMAGTFDIENYGDLLFPLIAAQALRQRNQHIRVVPYSMTGRSELSWPFRVRPMQELIGSLAGLSAMLIGGGQIVRFDRGYADTMPVSADMPFASWLTPAALAVLAGKPVIWNAVGTSMARRHAPLHDELVGRVFAASYFVGVRDVVSRDDLARVAPQATIQLLPDTAFGLSRVWPLKETSAAFVAWREALRLKDRYIVIQASAAVERYRSTIESLLAATGGVAAVVLPVCWCHGDRAERFPEVPGRVLLSHEWLAPRLLSEIIGRAEFVFASSLHACITALSYGVPGARVPISAGRSKYELLDEFAGIVRIDQREALFRLMNRGRQIEPRALECADRLDRYWDEVRDVALQPPLAHCDLSRSSLLGWFAQTCAERSRSGRARRLATRLRNSLAGRLTISYRLALRACLARLRHRKLGPEP